MLRSAPLARVECLRVSRRLSAVGHSAAALVLHTQKRASASLPLCSLRGHDAAIRPTSAVVAPLRSAPSAAVAPCQSAALCAARAAPPPPLSRLSLLSKCWGCGWVSWLSRGVRCAIFVPSQTMRGVFAFFWWVRKRENSLFSAAFRFIPLRYILASLCRK